MWLIPMVAELKQEFPYWRRLYGFWRTLLNFNPHTVSPEPGQDLEGEAMAHIHSPTKLADSTEETGHEDEGVEDGDHDGTAGSFSGNFDRDDEVSICTCLDLKLSSDNNFTE